jgi:hypothetical protein
MDAALNGKGVPIPINTDPLGINGGDKAAADASAGAVPKRGRSPEPVGVSMNDRSGTTPASYSGVAAADDASAMPASPARVPIPLLRPVFPNKAGKPLSTVPAIASSGDVY